VWKKRKKEKACERIRIESGEKKEKKIKKK
jgi:hypothetical protein